MVWLSFRLTESFFPLWFLFINVPSLFWQKKVRRKIFKEKTLKEENFSLPLVLSLFYRTYLFCTTPLFFFFFFGRTLAPLPTRGLATRPWYKGIRLLIPWNVRGWPYSRHMRAQFKGTGETQALQTKNFKNLFFVHFFRCPLFLTFSYYIFSSFFSVFFSYVVLCCFFYTGIWQLSIRFQKMITIVYVKFSLKYFL